MKESTRITKTKTHNFLINTEKIIYDAVINTENKEPENVEYYQNLLQQNIESKNYENVAAIACILDQLK